MRYFVKNIPAGGAVLEMCIGKVVTVQSCTGPVCISVDGGQEKEVRAGHVENAPKSFQAVNIINRGSGSVFIRFAVGFVQAEFQPGDNAVSTTSTVIYPNGGDVAVPAVPVAKKTGGTNWSATDGVAMNIVETYGGTPGRNYISGVGPGPLGQNRRKSIVFQNTTLNGNNSDCGVFDSTGQLLLRLMANNLPVIFETDATIYIAGIGGPVSQGALLYHEHYFANKI